MRSSKHRWRCLDTHRIALIAIIHLKVDNQPQLLWQGMSKSKSTHRIALIAIIHLKVDNQPLLLWQGMSKSKSTHRIALIAIINPNYSDKEWVRVRVHTALPSLSSSIWRKRYKHGWQPTSSTLTRNVIPQSPVPVFLWCPTTKMSQNGLVPSISWLDDGSLLYDQLIDYFYELFNVFYAHRNKYDCLFIKIIEHWKLHWIKIFC